MLLHVRRFVLALQVLDRLVDGLADVIRGVVLDRVLQLVQAMLEGVRDRRPVHERRRLDVLGHPMRAEEQRRDGKFF